MISASVDYTNPFSLHTKPTIVLRLPCLVHDDVLQSIGNDHSVIRILLDLSSAFDKVNHDIFLHPISNR